MGCIGWNDADAARFHLALFISDREAGAAFEGECDLHVRMLMQRRALPRLRTDDVGREGAPCFSPTNSCDIPTNGSCSRLIKLMPEATRKFPKVPRELRNAVGVRHRDL